MQFIDPVFTSEIISWCRLLGIYLILFRSLHTESASSHASTYANAMCGVGNSGASQCECSCESVTHVSKPIRKGRLCKINEMTHRPCYIRDCDQSLLFARRVARLGKWHGPTYEHLIYFSINIIAQAIT